MPVSSVPKVAPLFLYAGGMNLWRILAFCLVILGLSPRAFSQEPLLQEASSAKQGYFLACTKSEVAVYADGKRLTFRNGQSALYDIKAGSVLVVRHRSKFVYDGLAMAFVYQDRSGWIPFIRNNMRIIDHNIDPKNVTAEMVKKSTRVPKQGRAGDDFRWKGPQYKLPWFGLHNWLGVDQKNVWCMSAFVVTEEMIQPLDAPAKPIVREAPTAQILTAEQLSGIVIIEGDSGVGSGFITEVNGKKCIVTNLHVLGNNKKFTIKTLSGQDVSVDVNKLSAAVDADIALLELVEGQEDLVVLTSSKNVLDTTKIGSKVVVVGNRLGGGVATQTVGHVRGVGPTSIEVDAKFQSGNSGSPIYDIDSQEVVGVASYTETIPADQITGENLKKKDLKNETRWFGYRLDTVEKWQPLEWRKWRQQITAMQDYNKASLSALAVLKGNLTAKHDDATIQRIVTSFRKQNRRLSRNNNTAQLFTTLARYLSDRKKKLNRMKFYNYFHSCPYWASSLPQQNLFRDRLIEALTDVATEIRR